MTAIGPRSSAPGVLPLHASRRAVAAEPAVSRPRAASAPQPGLWTSIQKRVGSWLSQLARFRGTDRITPELIMRADGARVMTFNIKAAHGAEALGDATPAERERNLREIAAFIQRWNPDVVLLQEVEQNFDRNGRYPMFDRLVELTGATGAAHSGGSIGVAVLTRNGYRIRQDAAGHNIQMSRPIVTSSVLAVPVESPDGREAFTVVNAHVNEERLAPLADAYLKKAVAGQLGADFPRRTLVGGDFNAHTTAVHEALASAAPVQDVFERSGEPLGDNGVRKTSTVGWPFNLFGIHDRDQLHVTSGFGDVRAAHVLNPTYSDTHPMAGVPLSDHRPLLSVVNLGS